MSTENAEPAEALDAEDFGSHAPRLGLSLLIAMTRRMPNNWLGKRLAFALRRLGLSMLSGPVDIQALGARFRLHPFDNVCERRILFTPQLFDPVELALLESRISSDFVFVDIGANVGAYSLFVSSRAGPTARVLAIEPQPMIFDRLIHNIQQNPAGTIKAMQCAVADREGDLTLFIDRRNRGESSIKYLRPENQAGGEAIVRARTLLGILREEELSRVDAMKLDVEGAEDLALEPFFRDAPQPLWPKLILIERYLGSLSTELTSLLHACGYRQVGSTKLNIALELTSAPASPPLVENGESGDNRPTLESHDTALFATSVAS